MHDRIEATN